MARIYRTSRGEGVDMDMLRLSNEQTIAIGNMRTNARGDELGKGGQVVKSKAQIMQEYHKLNTPVVDNSPVTRHVAAESQPVADKVLNTPMVENSPVTKECSLKSFGHSGFTGTFAWADPENGLIFVFLSNRIYPSADENKLAKLGIRGKIHRSLYEAVKPNALLLN